MFDARCVASLALLVKCKNALLSLFGEWLFCRGLDLSSTALVKPICATSAWLAIMPPTPELTTLSAIFYAGLTNNFLKILPDSRYLAKSVGLS